VTELAVSVFASRAELDAALSARLATALAARGAGAVMLSGGTTPMNAYRSLARAGVRRDERLHVLFSDERYVPADSAASNYHQSRPLLAALALPDEEILRVRTELTLEAAAADYAERLTTLLSSGIHVGLGLLGLGADGHTASLFSAADLERARGRYALAVQRPDCLSAVSVSPEFLATVREPLFVVAGADKRDAVRALRAHSAALTAWRAVQGCARVELWMDEAAAAPAA
jgi:6-phosphogluconolactonase